ncbi:cobalt ECF transporter T component CbiQ [Oscillibacter valericigenes]|uniref:cobalt ECF transporter T component CbiQ n=1 Tax=Oscillibacter valericigenes TaxID=351091 RepID=UPI001F4079FE|nr:cobalt ECF transporter T component CbiQ [Oscillibacter valericigenes]MCF2616180.1 cobalt ECF transporter T component CbiQ [Oscillibacter valericigenes]
MAAVLAGFVLFSLFVGTLPTAAALALCVLAGGALAVFGHHSHGGVLVIDVYARRSRYFAWSPALKTGGCVLLLVLCVASPSPWVPLALALIMAFLTVWGGIRFHDYLALLSLPAAFLLLSGLALLWDYVPVMDGVAAIPLWNGWLVVTAAAQVRARLVMARALGAMSCLYFLSLSTTMPEILSVLRRAHVPSVMTELAVLIYRYLFVLLSAYETMQDAAASRLGYSTFARSIRTTGAVYGNLLAASFRRAGACFDAMESRCYDGEIRFLEREKPVTLPAALLFGGLLAGTAVCMMTGGG